MAAEPATRPAGAPLDPQQLLADLRRLVEELHPSRRGRLTVTLDSSLDRDLGLDSLARIELLARLERAYGVSIPESAVANADPPRDVLRALLQD